jgi:hypothetical protein
VRKITVVGKILVMLSFIAGVTSFNVVPTTAIGHAPTTVSSQPAEIFMADFTPELETTEATRPSCSEISQPAPAVGTQTSASTAEFTWVSVSGATNYQVSEVRWDAKRNQWIYGKWANTGSGSSHQVSFAEDGRKVFIFVAVPCNGSWTVQASNTVAKPRTVPAEDSLQQQAPGVTTQAFTERNSSVLLHHGTRVTNIFLRPFLADSSSNNAYISIKTSLQKGHTVIVKIRSVAASADKRSVTKRVQLRIGKGGRVIVNLKVAAYDNIYIKTVKGKTLLCVKTFSLT